MTRWLLDTDHVSLQERGHPILRQRLADVAPAEVSVSVVTMEEMLRGRLAILARQSGGEGRIRAYRKLLETVRFFAAVPVVPFDTAGGRCRALRGRHFGAAPAARGRRSPGR